MNNYIYNGRMNDSEIHLLNDCIGKSLRSIHLENINIAIEPKLSISTIGRLCFRFYGENAREPIINIAIKPFYRELDMPIGDFGTIKIQKSVTYWLPLKEKITNLTEDIPSNFVCHLKYPYDKAVVAIKFYGFKIKGNLKKINPEISLIELEKYRYLDFPEIDINSIEYMLIEHQNGVFTKFGLQNSGFSLSLSDVNVEGEEFVKGSIYPNNIVLQHEIK